MNKIRYGLVAITVGLCSAITMKAATAGEVIYDAGIETRYIDQRLDVKNESQRIDTSSTVVRPFFAMIYSARAANLFVRADHNKTNRSLDEADVRNDYTEYSYFGDYSIVRNLLVLTASGSQGFRSPAAESLVVDDFLLNASQLNKTQFNELAANLTLPRGDYFGLEMNAGYSKQKVENSRQNTTDSLFNNLNNDSYTLGLNAITGEVLSNIRTTLSGLVRYSEREGNTNFISQLASLNNDIKVVGELGLAINATYENNEIKSDNEITTSNFRKFYSAGVGLIWQSSNERAIEVAINRSKSTRNAEVIVDEDDDNDTFISFDINWQFSNRTNFQATFNRRFFGDAGNVLLSHSLRNWRTRVSYSEDVSTNLQLLSSTDQGLFVCDNGSTDIADCSLTESLDTALQPGQVIVPFLTQNLSLNDRVILRRRAALETALTRRRTTISLIGSISDETELEFDRDFRTEQLGTNISFAFSTKTNLKIGHSYSKSEGSSSSGQVTKAVANETNISLTRDFTQRLSGSLAYRRLDREGDLNRSSITGGIDGPFTDNRIILSIKYNYGNRR